MTSAAGHRVGGGRIFLAALLGFFVASNLNWAIASFVLNPWAMPLFEGFMRSGDDGASGLNIAKMTLGFLPALLVSVSLLLVLPRPGGWVARSLVSAVLVCFPAFFGTYTFLSGWGDVNWLPLMGAAIADTLCILVGTIVAGWIMRVALTR